jgi:hypothetical protein
MNDLREKVARIIIADHHFGTAEHHMNCSSCYKIVDQILALFPTQLTEEQIDEILPKKKEGHWCQGKYFEDYKEYNQAIDDCKSALIGKCGVGLSNYEIAKRIGGVKFWCAKDDTLKDLVGLKGLKQIIDALATPTFSGGELADKEKQIAELQLEVNILRKNWFNNQPTKPKDRIEELDLHKVINSICSMDKDTYLVDKINTIIRHINKERE